LIPVCSNKLKMLRFQTLCGVIASVLLLCRSAIAYRAVASVPRAHELRSHAHVYDSSTTSLFATRRECMDQLSCSSLATVAAVTVALFPPQKAVASGGATAGGAYLLSVGYAHI
jgi:hypothetical protein